jgi:hypothetical protein
MMLPFPEETKNPFGCRERVFFAVALAELVTRPQADHQIGAMET